MFKSTTILAVRHRDHAVLAGDGQVTLGQTVVKQSARKIRRLYNDRILAGFAGSAAGSGDAVGARPGDGLGGGVGVGAVRGTADSPPPSSLSRCRGDRL